MYFFGAALLCRTLHASTPPTLPQPLPPTDTATTPHIQPRPPITLPPLPWSKTQIHALGFSGAVERDLLAHLQQTVAATSANEGASATTKGATRRRLQPSSQTSVVGTTYAATLDVLQDIEPAVITNRFGTVDRTTTAFTQFDASNIPHNYWTSTTDFINFTGGVSGQQLPLPLNTSRSSDPMLSENPYDIDLFRRRTYCSGVAYDVGPAGTTTHSTLNVWYSDDPGTTPFQLFGGMPIDSGDYPLFLDKPSIATSWHGGTLGWTYVAAVVVHYDQSNGNGYHDIQLYRLMSQVPGFELVNRQFSDILITSPIVVVDSNNGNVYLLWLDPRYQVIQIARSTNYGNTFSPAVTLWPGHLLRGDINESINGSVKATSVIMARFNPQNNSIGVTWHQREADVAHTDVFFDRFDVATQTWGQIHHVGHPPQGDAANERRNDLHDQWNPALDPSSTGAYLVTWYDRRDDPNDITYKVWGTKINADGTELDTSDTLLYSNGAAADTSVLQLIPPPPTAGGLRYMGEYQDVFEWYGTWNSSTTYIEYKAQVGRTSQDVYLPRVAP